MINLRYKILRELGSGGSGTVLLAEDIHRNHVRRALKILRNVPPPAAGEEDPFMTEIAVLLSGRHPHLVTLYDFDTVRQAPCPDHVGCRFLTMEYVGGSDVLEWIRRVPAGIDRAGLVRGLLLQCLSALSSIHARGFVHADVKPQNLLVAGDPAGMDPPVLKLGDFGFSWSDGRVPGAPPRGTLEYAAPEILTGTTSDRRIDLYAAGAAFYHVVEGRPPFEAKAPVELIKKILNEEPRFCDPLWNEAPDVRDVVRSLLKKNAQERFPGAREAAALLGSEIDREIVVPFVGREKELDLVRTPGPTAFLFHGPEGMGKSRLLEEIGREARIGGRRVFRAAPVPGGIPYSAVRPLLQSLLAETRSFAALRGAPDPGEFGTVERWLEDGTPPGGDAGGTDRESLIEAMARGVIESASLVPLALVADDCDAMDEDSLQVLQTIARDMPPGRAVLFAAAAVELPWSRGGEHVVRIPLAELTAEDVTQIAGAVVGAGGNAGAAGRKLFEILGGMPLVIVEALRALQGSALGGNAEIVEAEIDRLIPRDADNVLLNRFSGLSPGKRNLFSILCCFEYPAAVPLLEQFLPYHPARVRADIRAIEDEGLMATSENEDRVAVRIGRLKKLVYQSLGPESVEYHRMIAKAVDVPESDQTVAGLLEAAFQYSAIGGMEKASERFESAARRVLSLGAFRRAAELFSRAADAARDSADRGRTASLRCREAEALLRSGSSKEAMELGTSMMQSMSPDADLRRSLLRTISIAHSRLGEYEKARSGLRELVNNAAREEERAELEQELVSIEISVGGFNNAEEKCRSQLVVADRLGDNRLKGAVYTDLGIATFLQDRFDESAGYFREALDTYRALGDESHVASALTNIGNALSARGDSAGAIREWRAALDHAASAGTLSQRAKIRNNMGIAHFNLGEYAAARECYTESRDLFERLGLKGDLAYTLTNIGEVMLADGEYGRALSAWTSALDLYRTMADTRGLAETFLQLAELRLTLGDGVEAGRLLEEAGRYIDGDHIEHCRGSWKLWSGVCAMNKEDYPCALELLREAHGLLQSSGERRKSLRCLVTIAACTFRSGEPLSAAGQLAAILAAPGDAGNPFERAESRYLLGLIEKKHPGLTGEKPLQHFKVGMDILVREPVGEMTWKISYALAREYFERGLRDRAREYLLRTEKVLRYFISSITGEDLRGVYLGAEDRAVVLRNVQRLLVS